MLFHHPKRNRTRFTCTWLLQPSLWDLFSGGRSVSRPAQPLTVLPYRGRETWDGSLCQYGNCTETTAKGQFGHTGVQCPFERAMTFLGGRAEDVLVSVAREATLFEGEQAFPATRCTGIGREVPGWADAGTVRSSISFPMDEKHLICTYKINEHRCSHWSHID